MILLNAAIYLARAGLNASQQLQQGPLGVGVVGPEMV